MTTNQKYLPHTDLSGNNISSSCASHIAEAQKLKNELLNNKSNDFSHLITYNEILIHMDSALSQSSLLSQVHPIEDTRKKAEECEKDAAKFLTELSLNKEVYNILKSINSYKFSDYDSRMLSHTLRDFKRAGVDKDDETRAKIKKIKDELVAIGQEFSENIRKSRFVIELNSKEDLLGLPKDYIDAHQPNENGKIQISTDYPDYIPFMKYAQSNEYRKQLRYKYLNRAADNEKTLKDMIKKRYELAKLLGYNSYADYASETKMIKKASAIHEFIDKISQIAKKGADEEYEALLNFKHKTDPNGKVIEGFESAYIEEGFKKEFFNFDSQSLRPYFSYDMVRDGLLALTAKLFGISYQKVSDAKVWDNSVESYDIYDESGKLGRIHLDMHPRDGKFTHAAQFTVQSGISDRQYPEGVLVCNFPQKTATDNALMEHREVVTFFHEFGHLLHHIFAGRQKWVPFSGVATEWDFVEAPSQFFEEWAYDKDVLKNFAKHYETGEVIPDIFIEKLRNSGEFGKALQARQQMFYAALSVNYYDNDPNSFDILDLLKELQKKYSYYPYEEGTHFINSFGHLDDYSALYYTYMWSLSIAKDIFTPFKKDGLMNIPLAQRYRDIVLKQGGAKDASVLIAEFLQRPFSFDAFESWLTSNSLPKKN